MFIEQLTKNPQEYFAAIIVVILSICLHELAHGFTAIALGDRTPEETGHITLNPFVHMPGMSFVLLFVAGISWGRMPIDPTRLRGRYSESLVAVAGPLTNLLLAGIGMGALGLWLRYGTVDLQNHVVSNGLMLLLKMCELNLVLFAFNLIPVPPLDGSRILGNFIPAYRRMLYDPTMQGVFLALSFGLLMGAGQYLWPYVDDLIGTYIRWVLKLKYEASR